MCVLDNLSEWAGELHCRLKGPNFSALCKKASHISKKRKRERSESTSLLVPRFSLVSGKSKFVQRTNSGLSRLDGFLDTLRQLDVLYKKRSIGQRDFHEAFTIASLPHIVGEDAWDKNRSLFLEKMDTDEYRGEVLITTPR